MKLYWWPLLPLAFIISAKVYQCQMGFQWESYFTISIYPGTMMTSSNGNIFCVTGPLCGEFTGHRWFPLIKASEAGLWCFSLICAWTKAWVNNREACNLRRHRAHYVVSVMTPTQTWPVALKQFLMHIIFDGYTLLWKSVPSHHFLNNVANITASWDVQNVMLITSHNSGQWSDVIEYRLHAKNRW